MLRYFLSACFGAKLALLAANSAALADSVKLVGRPEFEHVHVRGVFRQMLRFRGLSGQILNEPLPNVSWVHLSGRPAFNAAEDAAADGDWPAAVAGYELALSENPTGRIRTFVDLRLMHACDHDTQFDRAVVIWLRLLLANPEDVSADCAPNHAGPKGSPDNRAALDALDTALTQATTPIIFGRIRALRLQIMIHEGLSGLPPPPASSANDNPATSQPTGPLGILPPTAPAESSAADMAPLLTHAPLIAHAINAALDAGQPQRARQWLDRTRPYLAPDAHPRWKLLDGRVLLAAGENIRAADCLLDLAFETDDPTLRSAALYYGAVAHERLHRPDVARKLLQRVLVEPATSANIRQLAHAASEKLGPGEKQLPTTSAPAP